MKPLPEAVREFSALREDAGIHVIQITPAPEGAGVAFACEQASFSGRLAERFTEAQVLLALIRALDATAQHYRELLGRAQRQL